MANDFVIVVSCAVASYGAGQHPSQRMSVEAERKRTATFDDVEAALLCLGRQTSLLL